MRRLWLLFCLALAVALAVALPAWAHDGHGDEDIGFFEEGESNSDYFLRKSDEAFHLGDYERAVQLHRARVAIDPEAIDSWGGGAWLLWSMGRSDEAAEFIERGLKTNPDNWEMWDEAGEHYDFQKRLARAEECYKRAVELLPPDEPSQMLRRRLAHAADKAGDFQTAVETWRGLVRDFPDEAVNRNNLRRVENLMDELAAERARAAGAR